MDPVWIAVAFALGLGVRMIGLPPLVGFLAAGFVLKAFGAEGGDALEHIADLGVYLLLFGIGLKLKLKSLARPEIWGVASIHMAITTVVFAAALFVIGLAGAGMLGGMSLTQAALIGFALSFSSTVFAVKVLEATGEEDALHGRIAIGILIVQDIFAILFLTASTGKIPSPWAFGLLALPLLRPVLMWIMSRSGHGELLVLLGVLLVLGTTELFSAVGMKPDLGALVIGVIVGSHPKSNELSKTLMGFKDLFLVGFFLTIGLKGAPSFAAVGIAAALTIVIPLKVALFFFLMTKFRLRSRTALLGSANLANYSEFGLIVAAVGESAGWIGGEWLVVIAIALALTFVAASPLNARGLLIYERFSAFLRRWESDRRIPGDEVLGPGDAVIAIFGMGRVGTGAYDALRENLGEVAVGIDRDLATVERHTAAARRVVLGDATDRDFHAKVDRKGQIGVVILGIMNHRENLAAIETLRASGYEGTIIATGRHADQLAALEKAGARAAYDLFADAGAGLAEHAVLLLGDDAPARKD